LASIYRESWRREIKGKTLPKRRSPDLNYLRVGGEIQKFDSAAEGRSQKGVNHRYPELDKRAVNGIIEKTTKERGTCDCQRSQ